MQRCGRQLTQNLENHFREIITAVQMDLGAHSRKIHNRLNAFLLAAPTALALLAEPWWKKMHAVRKEMFFACADLHLYARILDDAVDEEEAEGRKALLRVQPLYWQAVHTLTQCSPNLSRSALSLVRQTVAAAETEQNEPEGWAKKNLHLLLIPLFLSGKKSFFERYHKHLAIAIALLQAEDEAAQGQVKDFQIFCNFITKAAGSAAALSQGGWSCFAQRIIRGCKNLLTAMESK